MLSTISLLVLVQFIFCHSASQDVLPRHSTCGSPQWSCSHSVQCWPPNPGRQWHWPVNWSGRILSESSSSPSRFHTVLRASSPSCSAFPGSGDDHSDRARSLCPARNSSSQERTGRSHGRPRSLCRDRLQSDGRSDTVRHCRRTPRCQKAHRCILGNMEVNHTAI